MVIRCQKCGAKYKIADEKIKPEGVLVRCARCKTVARVTPETAGSASAVVKAAGGAGPTQKASHAENGDAGEKMAAAKAPDDSSEPRSGPSSSPADGELPSLTGGSSVPLGPPSPPEKPEEKPEHPNERDDIVGDVPVSEEEAHEQISFDIGSWTDHPEEGLIFKELAETSEQQGSEKSESQEDFSFSPEEDSGSAHQEKTLKAFKDEASFGRRAFTAFMLLVLIMGGGAAGYLYWQGKPLSPASLMEMLQKQPKADASAGLSKATGQIRLVGNTGSFVQHPTEGFLFVIRGKVGNDFADSLSSISVRGTLYDAYGKKIAQKTVFCGHDLDDEVLKALDYQTIDAVTKNRAGSQGRNLTIAPKQALPYAIVFRNVPDTLDEFAVEVEGSLPVKGG